MTASSPMAANPTVSIVVPLFNKGPYVAATLASVQAQTLREWEMIVIDNGSTDRGPATVQEAARSDSRIRFATEHQKRGPGAARNAGLAEARGTWILFLDADDLLAPDHLASLLAPVPDTTIVAGGWQEFVDSPERDAVVHRPAGSEGGRQTLRDSAVAFAPWAVHAALVKRAALPRELWWPEELDRGLGEDLHFWFRLVAEHDVSHRPTASALYRVQTPNGRNRISQIEPWYAGIHMAVTANVRHVERRGWTLTNGQRASLMRLYSELYWQARAAGQTSLATTARTQADRWLRACAVDSWSMRARRLLGLNIYLKMRYMILGEPAHWGRAE